MADADTVASLRYLINELEAVEPYTDARLGARIDAADGDVRKVAGEIWTEKAAKYAELVDVQEGSSRRALSKLHEQALAMAKSFGSDTTGATSGRRPARTRPIVRP